MNRIGKEELDAVRKVLKRDPPLLSGFYKNPLGGPSVQAFEKALAEYHGMKFAVTASNGTTALFLALKAVGVCSGGEVVVPPLTFSATATAVMMTGASPVFVDVDSETYNMKYEEVRKALSPVTQAIIPVHLLGTPCEDVELIVEAANEISRHYPSITVIEDNAQGLGATLHGNLTGAFGDMSCLSFQETKTITTGGEGGAILTNNEALAEKLRKLRNHGQQYAETPYVCWNARMTEIQAAIGVEQLKKLDRFNRLQRQNAKILMESMPPWIHPPITHSGVDPTYFIIGCTAAVGGVTTADGYMDRELFVKEMTDRGVNKNLPGATVGLGYTRTIMDLPLLRPYKRYCPTAENLTMKFLWFDIHRWKTQKEMGETIKAMGW